MHPTFKVLGYRRSIEERRNRGEIACAECRLHKLRCNRKVPCSTCIRKGCHSVCPNGLAPACHAAAGVRSSKGWIADMRKRMRQLEEALQISHSLVSSSPHPLLAPDFLDIKYGPAPSRMRNSDSDRLDESLLEKFGAFSASSGEAELYIGSMDPPFSKHGEIPPVIERQEETAPKSNSNSALQGTISYLSRTFPFTPSLLQEHELQRFIEGQLPSYARASALIEAYLHNTTWVFRLVDREQLMEELVPGVYKRKDQSSRAEKGNALENGITSGSSSIHPHELALLLAVFAVGAAADLTLPPWNDEADFYYHLARAALGLKPVLESCGLHAVQAVGLIASYGLFSCKGGGVDTHWKVVSIASSLAESIGLNRDPSHFKLPPKAVQRRRRIFWELFTLEIWRSISTGRSPIFRSDNIDCELPEDIDAEILGDGKIQKSIWWMRCRYIKEIMLDVMATLFSIRSVKYAELLALDQKIRDYDPEGTFSLAARTGPDDQRHSRQCWMGLSQFQLYKDATLLWLHRVFFIHALFEDPINPFRTRFGPSFLSTYRSSASLVANVRKQLAHSEHYLVRLWPIWSHALIAIVSLASIAECGGSSALAPQAYKHFNLGYELITKVQIHPFVKPVFHILQRLRERAWQALQKHENKIMPQLFAAALVVDDAENGEDRVNDVTPPNGDKPRATRRAMNGESSFRHKSSWHACEDHSDDRSMSLDSDEELDEEDRSSHWMEDVSLDNPAHISTSIPATTSIIHVSPLDEQEDSFKSQRSNESRSRNAQLLAHSDLNALQRSIVMTNPRDAGISARFTANPSPYTFYPAAYSDACVSSQYEPLGCVTEDLSWLSSGMPQDHDFDVGSYLRPPSGLENISHVLLSEEMTGRGFLEDFTFFGMSSSTTEGSGSLTT